MKVLNIFLDATQRLKFLFFPENICGNAAVPPVLISKRIVGGVEAVVNAWPWQVSLQRFGKSLNQNYNTIIIVQLIGFMVTFPLQYKCSQQFKNF